MTYLFVFCRYMNRPVMSSPGLYDPTSIMNADESNMSYNPGLLITGLFMYLQNTNKYVIQPWTTHYWSVHVSTKYKQICHTYVVF
jgi:hypothetical protein